MTQSPIETLQPEQSGGWIEHDGKGIPVARETMVMVRHPDGVVSGPTTAGFWLGGLNPWHRSCGSALLAISAYRLHTPASSSEDQP